jgi:hypothetical protein
MVFRAGGRLKADRGMRHLWVPPRYIELSCDQAIERPGRDVGEEGTVFQLQGRASRAGD